MTIAGSNTDSGGIETADDATDTPVAAAQPAGGIGRRRFLQGTAAVAGTALGSGTVTGFPTIWAQNIKDIELSHVGVSYSVVKAIGDQASADLGFKVTMQNLDTSAAINRFITQPNSVDIADVEGWQAKLATRRGVLQGIERAKIKEFDNILPIFTKGELDGHEIPRQGISPYEAMYIEAPDSTELHDGVTDWMTFLPQVYNADSIGYRPDLVGEDVTEWKTLIDPRFKGQAAILDVPAIGIMDAALCFESAGMIKYGNKGNMTKEEIDKTIDALIALKRDGQFRATWTTFDQSVQLMAAGEVVIQSMWSPAVAAVRVKGLPCTYAPVNVKNGIEGYRGWCNGMALMGHLEGLKLEAAYEYLNWYLSGWQGAFVARYGYYSPVPSTAKEHLTPNEWAFWYEGKPAEEEVLDPYGVPMEPAGAVRDGGSFIERVTNISCWNTLMDEAAYMNKRWNDFKVA